MSQQSETLLEIQRQILEQMAEGSQAASEGIYFETNAAASNVGGREVRPVKWTENVEMETLGSWS